MPVIPQDTPVSAPDVNTIIAQAACFKCIPKGLEMPALIYMINQATGLNYTVEELIQNAACYKCIPTGLQMPVLIWLIDQLVTIAQTE